MATIDDLNKSISQMTNEELEALIIERRKKLRTRTESKAAKTTRENKEKKETKSVKTMLSGLTSDQRAQLLAELGAM